MLSRKLLIIFSFVLTFAVITKANGIENNNRFISKLSKNNKIEFADERKFNGTINATTETETVTSQEWIDNDWVDVEREITIYDMTAGFIELINQEPIDGEWVNETRNIVEFAFDNADSSFRFLRVFGFQWNMNTSSWDSAGRTIYNYDSNNFLTSVQQYFNLGGQELLFQLVEYTNNSVGRPLEEIVKRLNFGTMQLVEDNKTTYVYDQANLHYLQVENEFDFENGSYIETYRTTYTRNSLLNPITEIYEYYDNGTFHNGGKTEITYLPNGDDETLIMGYGWDGSTYTNSSKETITYTSFGERDIYTYETFSNGNFNPWLKTTHSYDDQNRLIVEMTQEFVPGNIETADYQNYFRELTTYGTTSVNDEKLIIKDFTLNNNYPNPFNPSTMISYQLNELNNVKLTVYDILGNEIAVLVNKEQNSGSYEVSFDGTGLSSGVYFYQIQVGTFFETKKMILNK